jgi:peroxiredoxin Q/BCP
MTIDIGDAAPDFTLRGVAAAGTDAEEVRDFHLADERGHPVVLVFYPGDNTPVCTRQLNTYTQDISSFADLGASVLAISPQSVESHTEFSCKQGTFAFPLLADVDKAVGQAYGIVGFGGLYRRSVFVLDASGTVTYAHRALVGATFRPTAQLVEALGAAAS